MALKEIPVPPKPFLDSPMCEGCQGPVHTCLCCTTLKPGWVGVDFDGTLVMSSKFPHVGVPIMSMVCRVMHWLSMGVDVRIFTARVGSLYPEQINEQREVVKGWCREYFGRELPVTAEKDQACLQIWDDRAVQVIKDKGQILPPMRFAAKAPQTTVHAPSAPSVPEILHEAAATFQSRNKTYGNAYKKFGALMAALHPDGLTLSTPNEWTRLGLVVMKASKLTRYCSNKAGHIDSAHDDIVYSAMLEEVTREHLANQKH